MKQLAIPGGRADPVVGRVLTRLIPDAVNLVGGAGSVPAAALRHRLAERDHALAELLAISAGAAPDQACADRANRQKQDEETGGVDGCATRQMSLAAASARAPLLTRPKVTTPSHKRAARYAAQALDRLSGERVRKG